MRIIQTHSRAEGFINICVNFDKEPWHTMLEKLDWFWKKYVAPRMLASSLNEKPKKVYSENATIFIEKDDAHILSEHALSEKSNYSELINSISGKNITDTDII